MIKRKHLGCGFWISVIFLSILSLSTIADGFSAQSLIGITFWSICLAVSLMFACSRQDKEEKAAADKASEEMAAAHRAKQKAAVARKLQRDSEQEQLACTLTQLVSIAREAVEILSSHISQAEAALDLAEQEFSDGAFAPFWDAVEKAVISLDDYDACVRTLADNSKRVSEDIGKLDKPPRLDFPKANFPEASPTLVRMARVVRQAQKDFHFATIYEQRRTNGILVAGFANLASALDEMGARINKSIGDLSKALDSSITSMARIHADQLSDLISGMTLVREQLASDSDTRRQHEESVEGMLNNIQHHTEPSSWVKRGLAGGDPINK